MLREVAQRAGFEIRYESALWDRLIQKLIRRQFDMICTAATITEERRRLVDFSVPYLEFDLAIVVHHAGAVARSMADLAGQAVGVRVATTAEQFIRQNARSSTVHSYHFNTESALALRALHAVIDDFPIAKGFERLAEYKCWRQELGSAGRRMERHSIPWPILPLDVSFELLAVKVHFA